MKRTKRSVWHTRSLANCRSRPRSCPQWLWYFATPNRTDPTCLARANGWRGGRDRNTPRRQTWRLYVRGQCIGGVAQYEHNGRSAAYLVDGGCVTVGTNAHFGRRRDAKRWVEVESVRRYGR